MFTHKKEKMKFSRLTEFMERLEATTKRLEMFDILAELFHDATGAEIDRIIRICQGQLAPPFYGIELGISEKLLIRTISDASNTPTKTVQELFKKSGDLGATAEELLSGDEDPTVKQVYDELMTIADTSGKGSQETKINLLGSLFRAVTPLGARYLARFVLGRLRLGIGDPTVLEALALSEGDRSLRPDLERAYNLCSDLGLVATTLKEEGIKAVKKFHVRVGYPIRMALCERLPSGEEIIEKIGEAAIEAKYDGFRLQIHKDHDKVEIFSRNLERLTPMFPEITEAVHTLGPKTLILEGEALAHNEDTGELLPFQVTIQRRRKHNIDAKAKEFPLKFFVFELLFMDGEDYTEKPYEKRRKAIEKLIKDHGLMEPARMFRTSDPGEIRAHFEEFVEVGLEGIVAKRLDSHYSAGARNYNWIKLKRSYKGELADTVDVCIVGYYRGKGQRARFGLGAVLAAVYEPGSDSFKTVTKIGTGFTEEDLANLKATLDRIALKHRHPRVDSLLEPDVWVEPRYVVTVTADEITRSPMHTAGRGAEGEEAGCALRFPRAMKPVIREDKSPEDANTVDEIIKMAQQQKKVKIK